MRQVPRPVDIYIYEEKFNCKVHTGKKGYMGIFRQNDIYSSIVYKTVKTETK